MTAPLPNLPSGQTGELTHGGVGRVVLLTDADVFAGTERHMLDLAVALRAAGVEASVGCPVPSPLAERAAAAGVDAVPLAKRGRIGLGVVWRLRRLVRAGRVDLIHAHNGRTALQAAMAVRLAGRGRVVFTQHFLRPNRLGRSGVVRVLAGGLHWWVGRQVSQFVAISAAVRDQMLARGDCAGDRVVTVPNGIADASAGSLRTAVDVRQELGLVEAARLVVCAARIEAEKGLHTLVQALDGHTLDPLSYCIIAGQGVDSDAVQRSIAAAKLGDRIRLVGFRADVYSLMAAGDVVVLPSPDEPFGLVLVEAMALGRPVVACRHGGPVEIVVDGQTGLLVPPNDPAAMGEAIRRLLDDPVLRQRLGEAGRRRFEERFTASRMAAATVSVYRRATDGATPVPPAAGAKSKRPL